MSIDPEVANIIKQAFALASTLGTAYIYSRWQRPPSPPKRKKRRTTSQQEEGD